MSRATREYFKRLLDARWEPDVTGRIEAVPEPEIAVGSSDDLKRYDPVNDDWVFIKPGSSSLTPQSINWSQRKVETIVTIDCRTTDSYVRLEGTRDKDNNRENYGGLQGEILRIIDTVRNGHKEFDWIDSTEWAPLSEQMGYGTWRGAWEVRLTELAENINPPQP